MAKPNFMTASDWELVKRYATGFPEQPYLIAAIGWHETHWGRLGAGPGGWILGFGYYEGSTIKEKYRGLVNQVKGAVAQINRDLSLPLTKASLTTFALDSWKSSAPVSWAASVWSIYTGLIEGMSFEVPIEGAPEGPPEEVPTPPPGEDLEGITEEAVGRLIPSESETKRYWKEVFETIFRGCSLYFAIIIIIVGIIIFVIMRW